MPADQVTGVQVAALLDRMEVGMLDKAKTALRRYTSGDVRAGKSRTIRRKV
jgi:hypothetical protein